MMQGYVNTSYEAVISLVVKHNSRLKSINAVIDTGFTGFLSLPQSIIDELELPWSYSDFATLGDGSETLFDIHNANVIRYPRVIDLHPIAMNTTYIFILIFSLFPLLFSVILFQIWNHQQQSKSWVKTAGKILESSVDSISIRKTYGLIVRYTYVVKGQQYISDRLDFYGHQYTSERAAMAKLLPYSVGSKLDVYYDPKKPQNAVLNRHVPLGLYFIYLLMISAFMTVIVTVMRDSLMTTAVK